MEISIFPVKSDQMKGLKLNVEDQIILIYMPFFELLCFYLFFLEMIFEIIS